VNSFHFVITHVNLSHFKVKYVSASVWFVNNKSSKTASLISAFHIINQEI